MNRGFELGSYLGLGILLNALFLVGVKSKSPGTSDYHRIIVRHFAKWCKYKKTASRKDCGATQVRALVSPVHLFLWAFHPLL